MNKRMLRRKWRRGGWMIAAACVALSAGAIVLMRAPGRAAARDALGTSVSPVAQSQGVTRAPIAGPAITGHLAVSQHALLLGDPARTLAEFRVEAAADDAEDVARQPVALGVVLDVSGSMYGPKLEQAKDAVRQLVGRMRDDDEIALVVYNDTTRVVQGLGRVSGARESLYGRIEAIESGGGTIIPQALEAGARMLAGAPVGYVRRLVLLSDGLDGSGLGVEAVASEVRQRSAQGVFTSSLGIGTDYDERFMTSVADAGRGNYEFLADGEELQAFLHRELEQASTTVVDQLVATIRLPAGMTLAGAHGVEVRQQGQLVVIEVGSLFAGDSRRAVLDLRYEGEQVGALGGLRAEVDYREIATERQHRAETGAIELEVVVNRARAEASRDEEIYARTWATVIDADQKRAVEAWRSGDVTTAKRISASNRVALETVAEEAPRAAPALRQQAREYEADNRAFGSVSAASAQGRSYGLERNATRRERALH